MHINQGWTIIKLPLNDDKISFEKESQDQKV